MIVPRALVLIDTSAWIEALRVRGDDKIRAEVYALIEDGRAAWCHIVRLELWAGAQAREIPRLEEMRRNIRDLETSESVWNRAYELALHARARGFTVPAGDLLIAACADYYGVKIVHQDRHFEQIAAL
ncbi:MAG: PIN domain-containing protein [Methylacidiphilales bacterium]|nr:PIN domain-containing protein [Candidatus Methylacidiphilales bacterium]